MTRVKKAVHAIKHRRSTLQKTKGYRFGRSTKEKAANEAIVHAGKHAFNDRRKKKGVFRALWNIRINAALTGHELSYSKLINALKVKEIGLNRKVLSEIANENPETFSRILETVQK